ncbi:NETI motif-containing protein [Sporolactobacillus sp. CPB3-1]|uniref:NETI motif-containing protein n=1 Tax=Sporolactobacillus mangiferae TaxID=2940498 RepID=A0ABT0MCX9_9BACL|nr:NETI motif-containing protein [Sporolactobacillus mangiferae]MCL1632718.1 NETI motif-containing protein [Sporolactobacillus mangiferae]
MKKRFMVTEGETISQCVERMKSEGYMPVRRMEKPLFRETATGPECIGSQCVFEGKWIRRKGEQ